MDISDIQNLFPQAGIELDPEFAEELYEAVEQLRDSMIEKR